jgi:hypothetical protein
MNLAELLVDCLDTIKGEIFVTNTLENDILDQEGVLWMGKVAMMLI